MEWTRLMKDLIHLGLESFGRYYSVYRGYVADVDDPENLSRLRLIIPDVGGTNVYDYWAFPRGLFSGEGYGVQMLPQKGDTVWVEFEKGHPNKPVWSHGHRALNELPTEEDVQDKDCIWLITPKGHRIKINDTKNYIHIKTQQGDYLELNSNSISLVTDKKISLGKLDGSDQPAVLGNTNEEVLETLRADLASLINRISLDVANSKLAGSPVLIYSNLNSLTLNSAYQRLVTLKGKIPQTKSNKVTLD